MCEKILSPTAVGRGGLSSEMADGPTLCHRTYET